MASVHIHTAVGPSLAYRWRQSVPWPQLCGEWPRAECFTSITRLIVEISVTFLGIQQLMATPLYSELGPVYLAGWFQATRTETGIIIWIGPMASVPGFRKASGFSSPIQSLRLLAFLLFSLSWVEWE